MIDRSDRLDLPYLLPAQAQKHVTFNEAIAQLDVLVQTVVEGFDENTPPATPVEGTVWAIGAAPNGDWAGHAHELAGWGNNAWRFEPLRPGLTAVGKTDFALQVWDGTAWLPIAPPPMSFLDGVGINAAFDLTNRLTVSAPATLLNHEGAGHQLKINKALSGDTASLVFQTGFAGRAEMGTVGDDDFSIKVSSDNVTWSTGLSVDAATGNVSMPESLDVTGQISGTAVQQSASDTTPGRIARADYVYGPGNAVGAVGQAGGVPTGAVVERGSNANGHYARFADGTQICHQIAAPSGPGNTTWTFPAAFSTTSGLIVTGAGRTGTDASFVSARVPNVFSVDYNHWRFNGTRLSGLGVSLMALGRWY